MRAESEPLRVQSLAQSGLSEVPPDFIQPPHARPTKARESPFPPDGTIPTIDLFCFDATHRDSVRAAVGRACREWGAFQVTNHGVPPTLLDEMRRTGLVFFNRCSTEEKLKYACVPGSAASEGYGSKMLVSPEDAGAVLDWRDYFDHHTFPLSRRDPSRWPSFPPEYRRVVAEYADYMKSLAQRLLGLISESLGLPTSRLEDAVGDFYQNITVSYYPPCPQPDLTLGLQAHSDMGAITLLIQDDVGGLEVLKDGQWFPVLPLSDAVVVLLADQTEIVTNGEYRSVEHRAITNASRARLSVATFHDPAKEAEVSPTAELVSKSHSRRYRQIVYGDYVSSWYSKGPEGKRNIDALLM